MGYQCAYHLQMKREYSGEWRDLVGSCIWKVPRLGQNCTALGTLLSVRQSGPS